MSYITTPKSESENYFVEPTMLLTDTSLSEVYIMKYYVRYCREESEDVTELSLSEKSSLIFR